MTEQMPPVPFVPSEYARAGREWTRDTVHEVMVKLHPFLGSFPRRRMTEFPDADIPLPDSTDYRQTRIHHTADMTLDTALTFDVEAVTAVIHEVADAWGAQQSRFMIQTISDSATEAGNVVEIGPDLWEQYIDGLAQMEMDFDDKGESNVVLLVSPQTSQWMKEHPPTPEQQTRIDAIFNAKKEAHRAARDRRRFS